MGSLEAGWLALAISKARAENCFALGMGAGSLFGLVYLRKGTAEVAAIHLMQGLSYIEVDRPFGCALGNTKQRKILLLSAERSF